MKTSKLARGVLFSAMLLGGLLAVEWSDALAQQPGDCGYYINSNGHQVPRPCGNWRSDTGSPPQGATARCRDGTYSYSEHPHAGGTCSHHGGVASHLR
jgi:hypothetical protein